MNKKNPCCVFDNSSTIDFATECFKIFLPMEFGFVNFNIVHSLRREIVSDVWRLGMAYAYDDALEKNCLLTRFNAEWDMAIHLFGRDDFIGGSNHGDEVYYSASLFIDGVRRDIRRITELTEFENLVFTACDYHKVTTFFKNTSCVKRGCKKRYNLFLHPLLFLNY